MPIYDYDCALCGPFRAWMTMADAGKSCACPSCGRESPQEIAAPRLNLMNGKLRRAMARAETSSAEPKVVPRAHLANCGCSLCAGRKSPPPASRRWAIGHG